MDTPSIADGWDTQERHRLLRLAARLADPADAADLVQSTYVRALTHGETVHSPKSWLRSVLVNERRESLRSRHRREAREHEASELVEPPPDIETTAQRIEVARVLRSLVEGLEADVRLVVRERYFDGDTAAAIARRHAIPAGTVRWRLKRGIDHLRDQLDRHYGGRRGVWAAVVAPGAWAPTLGRGAASVGANAGGKTTAAAGKGTKMISLKVLLGTTLVATTVGGSAWIATAVDDDRDGDTALANNGRASGEPTAAPRTSAMAAPAPDPKAKAKAKWTRAVAEIHRAHAAHAPTQLGTAETLDAPHAHAGLGDDAHCDNPSAHVWDEAYLMDLATQISEVFKGCDAFASEVSSGLALAATVIGSPDVGTIVESVEPSGNEPIAPELEECLTQSMYTLELGPAESNFETTVNVFLGDTVLSAAHLDTANLDEETQAKVAAALAELKSKGASEGDSTVLMLKIDDEIGEDEPPTAAE